MRRIALAFVAGLSPASLVMTSSLATQAVAQVAPPAAPALATPGPAAGASAGDDLVIYRAYAEPTAFSPTIKVDGGKIAALPNRHYTSANIAPGRHILTVSWPSLSGQGRADLPLDIKAGERHYFEVTGLSRVSGFGYNTVYIRMASGVAEVAPDRGQAAIASCCQYKPSLVH